MLNRKSAPEITDAINFQLNLPPHQKISLRNGVDVYLVDMGTVDTLMMNMIFYSGNCFRIRKLVWQPQQILCLKAEPGQKRPIKSTIILNIIGAYLNRQSGHETAELTLHCMKKHFAELLPVVSELIVGFHFSGRRTGYL